MQHTVFVMHLKRV